MGPAGFCKPANHRLTFHQPVALKQKRLWISAGDEIDATLGIRHFLQQQAQVLLSKWACLVSVKCFMG